MLIALAGPDTAAVIARPSANGPLLTTSLIAALEPDVLAWWTSVLLAASASRPSIPRCSWLTLWATPLPFPDEASATAASPWRYEPAEPSEVSSAALIDLACVAELVATADWETVATCSACAVEPSESTWI